MRSSIKSQVELKEVLPPKNKTNWELEKWKPAAPETASGSGSLGSLFISLMTSSMSMIWSASSSNISCGGKLGPLQVSRSHRQTVACT